MLLTAALFLLTSLGTGAADNVATFNVCRLAGGLAVGAASVLAPAYIAEVAPAAVRGRLASLQQLAIVLGLFASFLCNYLLARAAAGRRGGAATGARRCAEDSCHSLQGKTGAGRRRLDVKPPAAGRHGHADRVDADAVGR